MPTYYIAMTTDRMTLGPFASYDAAARYATDMCEGGAYVSTRAGVSAYMAGVQHAENHAPHFRESPLSGEWAGESMPEIAATYGLPTDSDEWADDFQDGYEAARSAANLDAELGAGNY